MAQLIIYIVFLSVFFVPNYTFAAYIYKSVIRVSNPTVVSISSNIPYKIAPYYNFDSATGKFLNIEGLTYQHISTSPPVTYYSNEVYSYRCDPDVPSSVWAYTGAWLGFRTMHSGLPVESSPSGTPCISNPCSDKAGQKNYKLEVHDAASLPPVDSLSCYQGCQTQPAISWTNCIIEPCVSSIEYTYTGQSCNGESTVDGLSPGPKDQCTTQLEQKIADCGGSLNVQSFNFETCTGVCVPDPCHDKWLALVAKCGGIMAVSNWNSETCSGVCANDPIVNPVPVDSENPVIPRPPETINTTTKINTDGSKEVTQSVTNTNTDGTSVTTNTTTYYNSSNEQTSTTTTTSSVASNSPSAEPNFPVPESWYTPKNDLTKPLAQSVNYQQITSASAAWKETAPYQITSLVLNCLGYVSGSGCTYPPTLNIDLLSRFTSQPVKVDLSPFSSVVTIMKFFFSLLCLVATGKLVMNLFS